MISQAYLLIELIVSGETMPSLVEGWEPVIIRSALYLRQQTMIKTLAAGHVLLWQILNYLLHSMLCAL